MHLVQCGWPALVGWRFLCVCAIDGFLLWFRIAYACPTTASLCNNKKGQGSLFFRGKNSSTRASRYNRQRRKAKICRSRDSYSNRAYSRTQTVRNTGTHNLSLYLTPATIRTNDLSTLGHIGDTRASCFVFWGAYFVTSDRGAKCVCYKETRWLGMYRQSESRAANYRRHIRTRNASLPTQANHTARGARKKHPIRELYM